MQIESVLGKVNTQLAIIIDPPNQTVMEAASRVGEFIQRGGQGVLIGGSGAIEYTLFQDTVAAITDVTATASVPVWVLPGHIDQIPADRRGITGVLNYAHIMGSSGSGFQTVYPEKARVLVARTLQDRKIPSISTLYILCGDPNASVSRVSGILPLDLASPAGRNRFLENVNPWLGRVQCVFFESGSNTLSPLDPEIVIRTRQIMYGLRVTSSLFVSGGIRNPAHARLYADIADFVVVGGHFERNGIKDASEFVAALKG